MDETKAFRLEHGGKNTWFDCHRRFLPNDHAFRRNKSAFRKGKAEMGGPPSMLTSEQIWHVIKDLPTFIDNPHVGRVSSYGEWHNWTKRSIFWDLPYWKDNMLRHNLDVMHIEKNFFDNIFNTVMDIKEKTKDNDKARKDLAPYCR